MTYTDPMTLSVCPNCWCVVANFEAHVAHSHPAAEFVGYVQEDAENVAVLDPDVMRELLCEEGA